MLLLANRAYVHAIPPRASTDVARMAVGLGTAVVRGTVVQFSRERESSELSTAQKRVVVVCLSEGDDARLAIDRMRLMRSQKQKQAVRSLRECARLWRRL